MIIKSKLDINVKRDFIEYISSSEENAFGSLRHLVYDFSPPEKLSKLPSIAPK